MRLLHTSDWHLGRSLYGRKRYSEFELFLNWLVLTLEEKYIDVLLVAGDVFDTSTPSNKAQELYYRFLCRVAASCCNSIVIIAGNHDSPSFLNAPRELLKVLNVHVVGSITDNPEDEVIVLNNNNKNEPQAIVCAVPYLRHKDIRCVEAGENIEDKNEKLTLGLSNHYRDVCDLAEQKKAAFSDDGFNNVPIIAMGHLFTTGAKTVDGDGVRELYVGSINRIEEDVFPSSIDYLALGHLHVAQPVGVSNRKWYSGSPIPMGFGEANQEKKVFVIEFAEGDFLFDKIPVPCFQSLVRISGSLEDILVKLNQLNEDSSTAWLEIEYTGKDVVGNLREMLNEMLSGSNLEILRIKNRQMFHKVINSLNQDETLDDLKVSDVFQRCLETFNVPEDGRKELTDCFHQIVKDLLEEDANAE